MLLSFGDLSVNLIYGELGGFRRGKHSAALFQSAKLNVRMAVHGDDFVCVCVCQTRTDAIASAHFLNAN